MIRIFISSKCFSFAICALNSETLFLRILLTAWLRWWCCCYLAISNLLLNLFAPRSVGMLVLEVFRLAFAERFGSAKFQASGRRCVINLKKENGKNLLTVKWNCQILSCTGRNLEKFLKNSSLKRVEKKFKFNRCARNKGNFNPQKRRW